MNCPNDHGGMVKRTAEKEVAFRGRKIKYMAVHYVCPECSIEVDDISLASENQKRIADAHRKSMGLLTGEQIVHGRKSLKWNQEQLANAMHVGIASVKRWETGQIQSKSMDVMLRRVLSGNTPKFGLFSGNRDLSLPRIKLVLNQFSKELGREILADDSNEKLLYGAKYLWYADMISFRETGQGMTGATYARLPHGPQLNNYNELIPVITDSDESNADQLTKNEIRIIKRIAMAFPTNFGIYKAVHKERSYTDRNDGVLIPYSDAETINAL
jgi:putative zinc finger/helix-turn-helix YgiT family protein